MIDIRGGSRHSSY